MPLPYQNARRGYLEWFEHLLSPIEASSSRDALRMVADRVDGFNMASEEFLEATRPYLAQQNEYPIAAVDSLLNQIEGDLSVANFLWGMIESESAEGLQQTVRSSRLPMTLRRLANEIEPQIEFTAESYHGEVKRTAGAAQERDAAVQKLRFEIDDTVDLIVERTNTVGIRLVRDILTIGEPQWTAVAAAVDFLQGREKIGNIAWGLEEQVSPWARHMASGMRGVLVNIVQKVMIVIEKNDLVRYTISDWIEDLHEEQPENRKGKFNRLLEHLYQTNALREHHVPVWLNDALVVPNIQTATAEINQLGNNFDRLSNGISQIAGIVNAAGLFVNPTLVSVGLGLQIGLLGTLVFGGYDHLDEGARALNLARGVKQILIETLPVSPQTVKLSDNMRRGHIRVK